jgi:hypothetical protein
MGDVINHARTKLEPAATQTRIGASHGLLNNPSGASLTNIMSRQETMDNRSEAKYDVVPGLTEFLREEYYRKFGLFINGSQNEHKQLLQFWRENVSEEHKKQRERMQELKKEKAIDD